MKNKFQKIIKKNNGYTLLFAVLVSSLVLAIGISILSLGKKEYLMATSARDSSVAFNMADSAIECAVNADKDPRNAFLTSGATQDAINVRKSYLGCSFQENSTDIIINTDTTHEKEVWYTFHLGFGSGNNGPCASVLLKKITDKDGNVVTDIVARGYNLGWDPLFNLCSTISAKRVERAIHYKY